MVQETQPISLTHVDCACVIHSTGYDWIYVDRLYSMLSRHISLPVRLHVYTEPARPVPAPYIKHNLKDMGISGPKQSWWYKLQLFDIEQHAGPLLYFDLDVVVVNNIDWIWSQDLRYFWSIHDFKVLYNSAYQGINSSIMWWDTRNFGHIWNDIKDCFSRSILGLRGDQDYIFKHIAPAQLRYFDKTHIKSWRWQCVDGGYNFKQKCWNTPGTGTIIDPRTSIMVFHGNPKPHELTDRIVLSNWR